MEAGSASTALGQFLVLSLLIERFSAVGMKLGAPNASETAEDAPDPSTDPWQSWTKLQVVAAFFISLAVCYFYKLDLFSQLLGTPRFEMAFIGYACTSVVVAGGSTSIQKLISAINASTKSIKADAKARIVEANLRIQESASMLRRLSPGS